MSRSEGVYKRDFYLVGDGRIPASSEVSVNTTDGRIIKSYKCERKGKILTYFFRTSPEYRFDESTFRCPDCIELMSKRKGKTNFKTELKSVITKLEKELEIAIRKEEIKGKLVKAMQEQNEKLREEIEKLKTEIEKLKTENKFFMLSFKKPMEPIGSTTFGERNLQIIRSLF
jgi:hypothetical protein